MESRFGGFLSYLPLIRRLPAIVLICVLGVALSACKGENQASVSNPYVGGSGLSVGTDVIDLVRDRGAIGNSARTGYGLPVSWNSPDVGAIIAGPLPGESFPSWLDLTFYGSSSPLSLYVQADSTGLDYGTYTTTIRVVSVRTDGELMNYRDVTVNFEVMDRPTLSSTEFTFSMVEGTLPSSQTINLSRNEGQLAINGARVNDPSPPSWIDLNHTPDSVTASVNSDAISLSPGTYSYIVVVDYNGGIIPVPLTVNVTPALSVTSEITFNVDLGTTLAEKSRSITIASNRSSSINWSADDDQMWISLSPLNGDTASSGILDVSLVQSELDTMPNGTYTGTITVSSSDPNVSDATVGVTLNLTMPVVSQVAPYEAQSLTQAEVIVRGVGFQSLTNPTLDFGGNAAVSFSIISDTEIVATHSPLSAGSYAVNLIGDNYTPPTQANLVVLDTVSFPYHAEAVPLGGFYKPTVFYNAERRSLYIKSNETSSGDKITRYQYNAGVWTRSESATDSALISSSIAMTPNGQSIYAQGFDKLLRIDPDSLVITFIANSLGTNEGVRSAAFTNDGKLVFTGMSSGYDISSIRRYDFVKKIIENLYFAQSVGDSTPRLAKASANGSKIFLAGNPSWGGDTLWKYDARDETLVRSSSNVTPTPLLSVDRTGNRFLASQLSYDAFNNPTSLAHAVYGGDFAVLGVLPDTMDSSVISHDGTLAYGFDQSSGSNLVRKFDLTTPDGSGGFVEIGSGTVIADKPTSFPLTTLPPTMVISPDGGTLFLVGGQNFIVMPAP